MGQRLLVVAKDVDLISKSLPALAQFGHTYAFSKDLEAAKKSIRNKECDVVLAGSSFSRPELTEFFNFVTKDSSLPCLVFPEVNSRPVINNLLNLRIPNVLLPPFGAASIHRRLESLGKKKFELDREEVRRSRAARLSQKPPEVARQQMKANVEKTASEVLKQTKIQRLPPQPDGPAHRRVIATPVTWNQYPVYLIVGFSEQNVGSEPLKKVAELITDHLRQLGTLEKGPTDLFEVEMDFAEFFSWATENADTLMIDDLQGGQMTVAIVDAQALPQLVKYDAGNYYEVDMTTWLFANQNSPADFYLHLKNNNRFVHYIRKDTKITLDMIDRIKRNGATRVLVTPEGRGPLIAYCLRLSSERVTVTLATG